MMTTYLVSEETTKMIEELSPKSAAMIRAQETVAVAKAMEGERELIEDIASSLENLSTQAAMQETLDELVHDAASHPASDINNDGFESQVRFLLDQGYRVPWLRERLKL